jgi:hypothetical protein
MSTTTHPSAPAIRRPRHAKGTTKGGQFAPYGHNVAEIDLGPALFDATDLVADHAAGMTDCPACSGRGEVASWDHETGHSSEICDFCKGHAEVKIGQAEHWRQQAADDIATTFGHVDGEPPF